MKPRNKRERTVLALHEKLKPLTEKQIAWGWSQFPAKGYYRDLRKGRGLVWCSECGATAEDDAGSLEVSLGEGQYVCPKCGRSLELEYSLRKQKQDTVEENKMISFLTTCQGWQVVRTFEFCKQSVRGCNPMIAFHEVFEHWYDEDGQETIIGIDYTRTIWSFYWKYGTKMSIKQHNDHCSGYYVWEDIFTTRGNYVYPAGNITATLKRNGWSRRLLRLKAGVGDIIQRLLADRDAEWLVKTKQYNILDWLIKRGDRVLPYRYALKVALRAGYNVNKLKDITLWFDYLDLLNEERKDLHNAHYVCPDNLMKEHDRLVKKKQERLAKIERKRKEREAMENEGQYRKYRGMFFGVAFDDGTIYCHVLQSVKEFVEEAEAMHHCVYANGYWSSKSHPNSLILSARDKEGKRVETVEVNTKTWQIVQSRGACNQNTAYHGEIIALVGKYIPLMMKTAYNGNSEKITSKVV